jgi:alpha-L-fucosidase 2
MTDYRELASSADLHYEGLTSRSEDGLPLGNGTMGSMLWATPSSLCFQINHINVYANGCATNSFHTMDTDYSFGCGFVDIDFSGVEDAFTPKTTQRLGVYDAVADIEGQGVRVRAFISAHSDVLALRIEDRRSRPAPIRIALRALRFQSQFDVGVRPYEFPGTLGDDSRSVVRTGEHTARSALSIHEGALVLRQDFDEADFHCSSAVAVCAAGRRCAARRAHESEYALVIEASNEPLTVTISALGTFSREEPVERKAVGLARSAEASGFARLLAEHMQWWHAYWQGPHVRLHSADGEADMLSMHCAYFLYVMASCSRGGFLPRFGGLLWNTGGDFRMWGAQQWWHNESCYFDALPATGRYELMEPVFRQYGRNFASYAAAARQQWGSCGIWIPETAWADGMEALPEDIAAEMRALYLKEKPWEERSERFIEFARPKNQLESRWNWGFNRDQRTSPFAYVTHIFSTTAKIAYLHWLRYEYTLDLGWLREVGYPILKGCAEFYAGFPGLKKGADDKIHIHHVNNHEAIWGCSDSISELSAMHGILPIAAAAAAALGVDEDLRLQWRALEAELSPIPANDDRDAVERRAEGQPRLFASARKPAGLVQGEYSCILDPVVHYDDVTLETADRELLALAQASYRYDLEKHRDAAGSLHAQVLEHIAIAAARLGDAESFRQLVSSQLRVDDPAADFCDFPASGGTRVQRNRLTLREGPQAIDCQRLGRAFQATQNALLACLPAAPGGQPVMRVFGAWPKDWDAEFTLAAKEGFVVSAAQKGGIIGHVSILSKKGRPCLLRNPWPGYTVRLERAASRETLSGDLLSLDTAENEQIKLTALTLEKK